MKKPVIWNEPGEYKQRNVKVAWAMPAYGPIYPQVYANHLAAAAFASRYFTVEKIGKIPAIGTTDRMYLHTACNSTVKEVLQADYDYIFWTEADMLLPFYIVPKLLEHDKEICSGVYFLRNGEGQPCLYVKGDKSIHTGVYGAVPVAVFPEDAVFKVHCPGMGCVLMKRSVFEKIEPPWFDLKEGWQKDDRQNRIYGYGQDIYFYSKAADAGIEVWTDSSLHCAQVTESGVSIHDYRSRISKINKQKEKVIGAVIKAEGKGKVRDMEVPV